MARISRKDALLVLKVYGPRLHPRWKETYMCIGCPLPSSHIATSRDGRHIWLGSGYRIDALTLKSTPSLDGSDH